MQNGASWRWNIAIIQIIVSAACSVVKEEIAFYARRTWGFHDGEYTYRGLLGYDVYDFL
jgi:hypothetical protein